MKRNEKDRRKQVEAKVTFKTPSKTNLNSFNYVGNSSLDKLFVFLITETTPISCGGYYISSGDHVQSFNIIFVSSKGPVEMVA